MIDEVSPYYNPAGLSRLDKGKYVHLGLQLANGHEKMSYKGKEHKAHLTQLIPNVSLTSVDDNGAYFFTFGGLERRIRRHTEKFSGHQIHSGGSRQRHSRAVGRRHPRFGNH